MREIHENLRFSVHALTSANDDLQNYSFQVFNFFIFKNILNVILLIVRVKLINLPNFFDLMSSYSLLCVPISLVEFNLTRIDCESAHTPTCPLKLSMLTTYFKVMILTQPIPRVTLFILLKLNIFFMCMFVIIFNLHLCLFIIDLDILSTYLHLID